MSKADEILKKYEDDNEYHFHKVDREFILKAMAEYATECGKACLENASNNVKTQCEDAFEYFKLSDGFSVDGYSFKANKASITNPENITLL